MPNPPPVLTHAIGGPADGEPVVLLNGGMMTWEAWGEVAVRLREEYRVVGCDFRGQARTPGPAPAALEEHAEDVVRLLDHLGLAAAHLVGTSFGAIVGVLAAARHPRRVRSLVAATVADHATAAMDADNRETRRRVADVVAGGDRGAFHRHLVDGVFSPAHRRREAEAIAGRRRQLEVVPVAWFEELHRLLASVEGYDLRPVLGEVRCPTLVVLSRGDRVMPEERVRALAEAVPGARLAVHSEAGHALVVEDPDWLADVCRQHLGRDHLRPASDGSTPASTSSGRTSSSRNRLPSS